MRYILLLCPLLIATACSAPRVRSLADLPGPDDLPFVHRVDVQQGNVITQDMLAQLRHGMEKKKVLFVMGSPVVQDTFHADRWDYLYTLQEGRGTPSRRLVTLFFVDDKLDRVGGDVTPAESELVALLHHDLTVRVPRYKPKNLVERVVHKLPFVSDTEEQKVEVLASAEAAGEYAGEPQAADADEDLAGLELEQPVPTSPYANIQAAPGEGIVVPPGSPTAGKKKGFFARLLRSPAADEDDDAKTGVADGTADNRKYRDITDQSNI